MKIEIRSADLMHVSGYVNAVERDSKQLPASMAPGMTTPFVERIVSGTFAKSLKDHPKVELRFNHSKVLDTTDGTLKLHEDSIGLHAEADITDREVIAEARAGHLTGWSFGFSGAQAHLEPCDEGVQRRMITGLTLHEVSILNCNPAYIATSIEARGEETTVTEQRSAGNNTVEVTDEIREFIPDYSKEIEILQLMSDYSDGKETV